MANAREYAIMLVDDRGVIRSWSAGAQALFGYTPDEAIGQPVGLLFVPSDIATDAPDRELEDARRKGRAEDSRWHVRKDGERFWGNGVAMRVEEGDARGFLKILRDETRSKRAEEQRVLLLNELNHRIKNTLATVQSIVDQTLRAGGVVGPVRTSLTNRLIALAKAHDVLVEESWSGADLRSVIEQTLLPYRQPKADAFLLDGPPVRLSPQQALSLSLGLHELTTNAIKYGALSAPAGEVHITWNLALDGDGRRSMNLLWEERGGPPVCTPARTGFGARLISRTFAGGNSGRSRLDFHREGLRCVFDLPLSGSAEIPILDLTSE